MSVTEAPDMTVTTSSPWRCCGRLRKTSFGETGDTKKENDVSRTKKERRRPNKKLVFADRNRAKCVAGVPMYSSAECQRVQVNGLLRTDF